MNTYKDPRRLNRSNAASIKSKLFSTAIVMTLVVSYIFQFQGQTAMAAPLTAPPDAPPAAKPAILPLALKNAPSSAAVSAPADAPALAPTAFATGTLIIPMDVISQNVGMWKAYGLVYRLLSNGIRVSWAIADNKNYNGIDFSASVRDLRTNVPISTSYTYRGGPFIIDAADAPAARTLITAWWAANANQPSVHVANAAGGFTANVPVTLIRAPKIAQEGVNAGISIAYYNAAGIPDSAGNVWTTASPDIFNFTRIANGELATVNQCRRAAYDVYVTPHNDGFEGYSLTDPSNLQTRAYAQLMEFVRLGGGWTALCHSILSNEDYISDINIHGNAAVKSLFTISNPITGTTQITGAMLTITGFNAIQNVGGTWTVNNTWADLPVAQFQPTTNPQALPGGSVQTWLFNPSNVRYWPGVERVAYFTTNTSLQYDHIVNGSFQGGKGAGKVTFIGGHSFATTLPYLSNFEAPYLRAFYNSLFFNGAGKAQLDLIPSPDAVPQNITSTVQLSITNIGGSEATNLNDLRVLLEPGVQYVSNTGPVPTVTSYPTGTLLVWTGIGTVAAGATPIVITTNLRGGILGENRIAYIYTQFGDVFGEGFTANYCRSITIVPAPNPILSKTPSPQTVLSGRTASWTLTYANTGTAVLSNTVLTDTLPAGFQYVSSSGNPAVGAPLVTPLPNGTTRLIWSLGTLVTSTVVTRTIVITATSPGIEQGTETFTNTAVLGGFAVGGVPVTSGLKSAIVNVIKPSLIINKIVTPTEATPGSVLTYSIALTYTDPVFFTNAILTDSMPANTTYMAGSANAGAAFGNNTLTWTLGSNVAGVPGNSTGTPGSGTITLTADADTWINAGATGTNYGACTTFNIDTSAGTLGNGRTLVQFSLPSYLSNPGVTISSATLRLVKTGTDTGTTNVHVYRVTSAWDEGSGVCAGTTGAASWNNRQPSTAWSTAGGTWANTTGTIGQPTTSPFATQSVGANGTYNWSITSLAQGWANNAFSNFGVIMGTPDTGTNIYNFASRESATAANRPQLIITYSGLTASAETSTRIENAPLLVSGNNQVTVTMVLTSAGTITNVVPPASLTVTGTNGASATLSSGPTPSDNFTITAGTPVTLTYIYNVTPGANPGSITFGGAPSSPASTFAPAQSNSTLVVPILTFRVTINTPLPLSVNQVANTATFRDTNAIPNGQTSPPALTTILQPRLVIAKQTLATDPVKPGDRITYTLSVLNFGTGPANNAIIRDVVPVSTTYAPGSCAGGNACGLIGSTVVFSSASIPAFSTAVFTFAVTVNPFTVVGSYPITNVAGITSTEVVTPEVSNVVTNTMLIEPNIIGVKSAVSSNLSPTLQANDAVEPGDRITYTLVFTNLGPGVATNVVISDPVDSDSTVVTPVPNGGSVISAAGATTVTWPAIASLGVGAVVTRTFVVSINLPTGNGDIILNQATVSADGMAPRNTNETSFIVYSRPILTITKGSIPVPGTVLTYGQIITYSLVVTNIGNANTSSAIVIDNPPAGTQYVTNSLIINGQPYTDDIEGVLPLIAGLKACSIGFCDADFDAGVLVVGIPASYSFRVQVLHPITQSTVITNVANAQTPSDPQPTSSNVVTHSVQFPILTGVVTDVLSGLPIPGAMVVFTDAAGMVFTATSGIDGRYTITSTPDNPIAYGPGTVTGSATGYVPVPFNSSINIVNGINTKDVPLMRVAALEISKAGPASAVPGQQVTYTVRITNTGPSTATNVLLRDPAPAGLTFVSASSPCVSGLPCNVGTLNAGDSTLVTITFNIGSAVTGTITNVANVTATEWLTPMVATATTPLAPVAILEILKEGPPTVKPGEQVTYTIVATNTGPSAASIVTITDQPVAGMQLISVSSPCAGGFPCVIPTGIAVGASVRLTVTFNVTSSVVGTITNTASITSPETPQPPTSTVTTTLTPEANLQIVKLGPATAVPGAKITYTIAVTNVGPSAASIITITDPTPASLSNPTVTGPCDVSGFPCVVSAGLAVSASVLLTVTFDVDPDAAGTITNTASVTSPETPTPPTSTVTTTLTPQADIGVRKTAPVTATPGNQITYSIIVTNAGPSVANNVSVSDTFNSVLSGITWSCVANADSSCNDAGGNGNISTTVNLTVGGQVTLFITGTIAPTATGILPNTVVITSPIDTTPYNNTSTVTSTIVPSADLSIVKTGPPDVIAGTALVYTLTVNNGGPSAASQITITDQTPDGLTFAGFGGACSGSSCTLPSLAVGQQVVVVVTFTVPSDYTGTNPITNTAVVSASTFDPNLSNNTSTVTTPAIEQADLAISKQAVTSTAVPGRTITFTLVVTNLGPTNAKAVSVIDPQPAGLTFSSNSGDCTSAFPCNLGTIPFGQTRIITSVYTVQPGFTGSTVTNVVTATSTTPDPVTSNNVATETVNIAPSADVSITKVAPPAVIPGTTGVFTIHVTNLGPSNAQSVTVNDPTPAGLGFVSTSGDCTSPFPCVFPTLQANESKQIVVTFNVPASYSSTTVTNTATVTSTTPDPVTSNNTSTVTSPVTPIADLQIIKTGPATETPGTAISYQIAVYNAGPSDAPNAVVNDAFPSVLPPANISWTCVSSMGACDNPAGAITLNVTESIDAGERLTYTINALIATTATGMMTNTATVLPPLTVTDPVTSNNTSTVTTTLIPGAGLQIKKIGPATTVPGTQITYTIAVTNNGPSAATDIVVNDVLPAELSNVSITSPCAVGFPCNLGTLQVDESRVLTVTATVSDSAAGVITNTASVTSPVASNEPTSTVTTTLMPEAVLQIKKLGPATATPGTQITYTIAVTNAGPSVATSVLVSDVLPAAVSNASASCGALPCNLDTLQVNESRLITITATVIESAVGIITNTASVTSPETPQPPTSTITTTLTPEAVLQIKKLGPDTATPGTQITYTIAVTNIGPSNASVITITDPTPTGLSNPQASAPCAAGFPCVIPTGLAVGQSVLLTVTFDVNTDAVGVIVNTTSVTSPETPQPPTSTVTTTLTPEAYLQIKKLGPATATPGTQITYTIAVTNAGPSAATDVVVSDVLPAEVSGASASCGALPCNLGTLGVNESRWITITANVSELAIGIMTNTASVTSPVAPNAPTSTVTTTLTPLAILQIKKLGPATVVPGDKITYTIVVTNDGPSAASVVTITDPTPAGLSNPVVTGACNNFDCVIAGGLAVNASIRLTVTFDVNADAVGVITNTASVTSPETPEPPTTTVTTTLTPLADVGVWKTGPFTAIPGATIAYNVVVTNAGPSIATNVTVTDVLPANVTGASWQCIASAGSSCNTSSGSGDINTTVNLTVGGAITLTINGTVLAAATGQLVNTAVITTPADTTPDNNTSTVTTTLVPSATVTINKIGPATAVPGTVITYSIAVANAGPSDAPNAVLSDPTPAGLAFISATAPCAAGFPCSLGTVPAKSSVLITITFNVIATATGQVVNTASVTTPVIPEPPTSTVTTTLTPQADLSVVKTVRGAAVATPGGSVTYDIVVRNAGPSAVTDAPVTDALPAEFTAGFWSCVASAGNSCQPTPGSGNIIATVSLLPGGVATFTLDATVSPSAAGTITNTAVVTAPQGVEDPNPLNNTSTVTVTLAKNAFLGIFKTNNQSISVPGTQVTYTIVVSNAGPSDANNVTVNDTFPAELQNPIWTCAGVNGATCPSNGSGNINATVSLPVNSTLTFTVQATVALNAAGLLTNTASVQPPPDVVNTNPVTQSTDVDTLTPAVITGRVFNDVNGNAALDAGEPGISGVQITITPSTGSPFVVTVDNNGLFTATVPPGAYSFSVVPSTVPNGYVLTTGNATQSGNAVPGNNPTSPIGYQGQGTISGVVFEDLNQDGVFAGEPVFPRTVVTLTTTNCAPAEPAFTALSAEAVDASCTYTTTTGNDGRYSFTNVPAGLYTVTVGARPGYVNSTPLSQSGTMVAGGSNTHDFGFYRPAGIILTKRSETSLPNGVIAQDRLITYTLIATNTGGVTVTNVLITDQLPISTQLVVGSPVPAPVALSPLTWQFASLAPNQSVTVRFTVRLDDGFSGVVRNIAFVSPNELPQTPSNETVNPVQPTAIRLVSFIAERTRAGVRIAWQTSSEVDTFGFRVLRATSNDPSTAGPVKADLEPGKGSMGGSYEVMDASAEAGQIYYYWLEETELDGDTILYTEWVQRVAPIIDQGTRTFSIFMPVLMR